MKKRTCEAFIRMGTCEAVILTVEEYEQLEREVRGRVLANDAGVSDRICLRLLEEHRYRYPRGEEAERRVAREQRVGREEGRGRVVKRHPKLDELEAALVEVLRVSAEASMEIPYGPSRVYVTAVNATVSALQSTLRSIDPRVENAAASLETVAMLDEATTLLDHVDECLPTPDVSKDLTARIQEFLRRTDARRT